MNKCSICQKKNIIQYICPICNKEYCEKHIYSHICSVNNNNKSFFDLSTKSLLLSIISWIRNKIYNLNMYSYLIYFSIFIYILSCIFRNLTYNLCFFSSISFILFEPWRLITYIFIHGNFFHLLFNMIALNLFGSMVEKRIGKKLFLFSYIIFGISSSLFHLIFSSSPLIGSSGSIFGLLAFCSLINPNVTIFINFIPIKLKYAIFFVFIFDLFFGFFIPDNIAHFAHIGGLISGLLLGKILLQFNRK